MAKYSIEELSLILNASDPDILESIKDLLITKMANIEFKNGMKEVMLNDTNYYKAFIHTRLPQRVTVQIAGFQLSGSRDIKVIIINTFHQISFIDIDKIYPESYRSLFYSVQEIE